MRSIIAYPVKKGGSKWNNNELRLSLRSIEKHWKGEFDEIIVLGDDIPEWVNRESVTVVKSVGYMDAWNDAMRIAGPGGRILWMNDDILFCKDTSWEDLTSPQRRICAGQVGLKTANLWIKSANGWRKKMGLVMKTLIESGHTSYNFASHTPYVFEVDKLIPIFKKFGKLGYKLSVECAYYNTYLAEIGGTVRIQDKFRTSSPKPIPLDMRPFRFFNLCDQGLTPDVRSYLFGRFPLPCGYEAVPPMVDPVRAGSFRDVNSVDKSRAERGTVSVTTVDDDASGELFAEAPPPAPLPDEVEAPRLSRADRQKRKRQRKADRLAKKNAQKEVRFAHVQDGTPPAEPVEVRPAHSKIEEARKRTREWRNRGLPVAPPVAQVAPPATKDDDSTSEDFES